MSAACHLVLVSAIAGVLCVETAAARVVTYPAPAEEAASRDFEVLVDGQPVFCYSSFRCDIHSTETICGRPVSPVSLAYFDFEGTVTVTVRLLDGLREAGVDASSVVVRPLAHGIRPAVRDGAISFELSKPCQLSIEPGGGLVHPLHLFANPPEVDVPDPKDPNVLYFGPGFHEVGPTDIKSGQTVYIAGGAVVSLKPVPEGEVEKSTHDCYGVPMYPNPGMLQSNWQRDVTIRGRGILCGRRALEKQQRGVLIRVQAIENLVIEGVIIRESSVWSLNVVNCNGVRVSNVKVVGHFVNNDGICIGGTSNALVEDCFSHNADDSLEVKVWVPQENVVFRNCVVWTDIGGSLGMCCESGAELFNVLYENCTVIHSACTATSRGAIGIDLQEFGSIRNFRFENIVIEDVVGDRRAPIKIINNWDDWHMGLGTKPGSPYELANPAKREKPRGAIRDVVFRNVQVLHSDIPDVVVMADAPESPIEGVLFENVVVNGKPLVVGDERIKTNEWVSGVVVK